MSVCETTRTQISIAFDERRPGELPASAGRHLEGCAACQAFRVEAAAWDARLSRPVPVEAGDTPEGLHESIMAAVESAGDGGEKVVPFQRASWPLLGGIAAAAAAVVFALVVFWGGKGENRPGNEPGIAEVVLPVPDPIGPGLPSGFDVPFDMRGLTAAVGRRFASAYTREAEALASDMGKLRDYFGSRLRRGS